MLFQLLTKKTEHEYYLVEFDGLPFTEQDGSGTYKCECYWLYPLPNAVDWYTRSRIATTVDLPNVVHASVDMLHISASNMVPTAARRNLQLEGKVAE